MILHKHSNELYAGHTATHEISELVSKLTVTPQCSDALIHILAETGITPDHVLTSNPQTK